MSAESDAAIIRIAEVVMFENWLRFYFIAEEDGKLVLRLPDKALEQIRKRYAAFADLAEILNNEEIDHTTSLKAVCMHVSKGFEGRPIPEYVIQKVFDDPKFHCELQLFGAWVQAHEDSLDAAFMEFDDWKNAYNQWRETDEVRLLAERMAESMALDTADVSATVQ